MLKKSLATTISAALILTGPGRAAVSAAVNVARPVAAPRLTTPLVTAYGAPRMAPLSTNLLTASGARLAPAFPAPNAAPAASVINGNVATPAGAPVAAPAPADAPTALGSVSVAAEAVSAPNASPAAQTGALDGLYEGAVRSDDAGDVLGGVSAGSARLAPVSAAPASARASVPSAKNGGLLLEVGIGAAVITVIALVSKPFRDILARLWNVTLGRLSIFAKKAETPEVLAQRIVDQLNAAKPVYNRKVQEASTLVEKLKLQIDSEKAKVADLETSITALLSDSDPANDTMAAGLINQQKTLAGSIATSEEQLKLSEVTLQDIKDERTRFFAEREETIAKINAKLTQAKAAEIRKQMAELKGGFQIGDLKDNLDRLDQAVNDKIADANGTADSVASNPDEILKKAKDSVRNNEALAEIERRKKEIAEKAAQKNGGAIGQMTWVGIGAATLIAVGMIYGSVFTIGAAVAAFAVTTLYAVATKRASSAAAPARDLTMTEVQVLNVVGIAVSIGAGFYFDAILLGLLGTFVAPIPVIVGYVLLENLSGNKVNMPGFRFAPSFKWNGKPQDPSDKNGGDVLTIAGAALAVVAVAAVASKSFRDILARLWNVTLGRLSIFAKKAETPEVLAQRIIDQLNAAKPLYNRKVADASTLVESLKLQIQSQKEKSAELDANVTALLSDADASNDLMAATLLNQKKTIDASTAASEEQLKISEVTLQNIKDERTSFFAEREETIAKINAKLTQAKAAEIRKQMAELKGGFQIGDLKDNLDRLDQAVNDKIADANGAADSVASNPDEILKKAKDSVRNSDALAEIERRKKAIAEAAAKKNGGDVLTIAGVALAVVAVAAVASKSFRDILARLWNVTLGRLSIFAKKAETPEVLAQRIVDQLNAAKPVYNRKVQEASTLVEKLRLQIASERAKVADLETSITALLSDSDPANDTMAAGLINQQKTLAGSIAASEEQLALSEVTLQNIKDERTSFFAEREETIAKINAKLTQAKAAEIRKQMAELKGGFQIGDLKDNLDRLDQAVNDKIADANGAADSVASNPDEILKKAKDSVRNNEALAEIERRKKEIAEKAAQKNGGAISQATALSLFGKAIAVGFALAMPIVASLVIAGAGLLSLVLPSENGRKVGRQLAVIGLLTLVVGAVPLLLGVNMGFLGIATFGGSFGFLIPGGLALMGGILANLKANKSDASVAASVPQATAPVVVAAPTAPSTPVETAAPSKGASFSIKPLLDIMSRVWNALLGALGLGVRKLETPEILAQRVIDQLNAAKLAYNNKVKDASTLVESLKLQIGKQKSDSAKLDEAVTILLSDSDTANDLQAAGILNQKKTLDASTAATEEQLAIAQQGLQGIKEDRARFFAEREETMAKITAKLTQAKAAEIRAQMAALKGGFSIGDLKDNLDRLDSAVNDRVAGANGAADSVASNPDEILKKAKDAARSSEVNDELERRKREIAEAAAKKNGGQIPGLVWAGALAGLALQVAAVMTIGWTAALPLLGVMGWSGLAAGVVSYFVPDTRTGAIAGAIAGAILVALSAVASPEMLLLGAASGSFVGWFGAHGNNQPGIGGFIGATFGGMMVGMTLPAWLGALGAKKLLDNAGNRNGGSVTLLPVLAGATGLAALAALIGGGIAGFVIGAALGYVYLEHLSAHKNSRDINDLVFGVIGYGAIGAIITAIGSVLYFI